MREVHRMQQGHRWLRAHTVAAAATMFGKLKAFGEKVGETVETVGKETLTGVRTVGTTVGTGVVSLARDIKDGILDSDLDSLRQIHQFQRQQEQLAGPKRKQVTERELVAADQRADAVLGQLPQGYFDKTYDPVRHELSQLTETSGQEDIDQIVDRLGTCMEAVSGKLSRHVLKKRDKLIVGIDVVASVEDDIKAALAVSHTGRSCIRTAGEEVQRHLRVAGQTRRKQTYMQVMEVVAKIKQAKDLQKLLRRAQESGEYQTAILLCVQCFQNVESIKQLKVSTELLSTVQRLYVDTLHKLDGALTAICGCFDPPRYTKVLDAYLLQGISAATLAERALQSFKDALHDSTTRAVKSLLLTQPQLVSRLAGGSASLEGSFVALCNALPHNLLLPALTQVMEVCMGVMASYHAMALWHIECLAVNQQQQQERELQQVEGDSEAAADADAMSNDASRATMAVLTAVSDMMATSRVEVFTAALHRAITIIRLPAATAGNNLLQVSEYSHRFLLVGEAFCGCHVESLKEAVGAVLSTAFEQYHHANMQTLSSLMQSEDAWRNVGGPCLAHEIPAGSLLQLAHLFAVPAGVHEVEGAGPRDFMSWVEGGSPFKPLAPVSIAINLPVTSVTTSPAGSTATASHMAGSSPDGQRAPSIASLTPQHLGSAAADSSPHAGSQGGMQSRVAMQGPMLTPAARHMLACLQAYSYLYRSLGHVRAGSLWEATTQLMDRFVVATFMLLSGISVDALVLQDDVVTFRLQRALLRILCADGSRYKAHVEELRRFKAAQAGSRAMQGSPTQVTGISWLDRFGDKVASLAQDLDTSVTKLSTAIGDKVPGLDPASVNAALGSSLQERVVAGESLAVVAEELRAGRAALLQVLQAASTAVTTGSVQQLQLQHAQSPVRSTPSHPTDEDDYGFKTLTPPPRTATVRLQYQGMDTVLAHQQQQQMAGGSPASVHTPQRSDGGAVQQTPRSYALPSMAVTTRSTAREADTYFTRVVEAAFDLREALLQGGARALLGRLLDPERGVVAAIACVPSYAVRAPPVQPNGWVDSAGAALRGYAAALATRPDMPQVVQHQLWLSAMTLISDALTTGFSRVRKCTLEGRTAMSMDVAALHKMVRTVLPQSSVSAALAALDKADAYVRALYLPWDEFTRWCQQRFAEYGMWRLLPLIEQAAEVHKVKKQQKAHLLELLDALTTDF